MKILLLAFLSLGVVSAYTSYCLACGEDQAKVEHNATTLYLKTAAQCENTPDDRKVIPGMI